MKNELLQEPRRPIPVAIKLAAGARAVVSCDACLMAKFCRVKSVAACPTPEAAAEASEMSGDYTPPQTSYRNQLMDDRVPSVFANQARPRPKPAPIPKISGQSSPNKPIPIRPPRQQPRNVKPTKSAPGESLSDAVADFFSAMFGAKALRSAVKK